MELTQDHVQLQSCHHGFGQSGTLKVFLCVSSSNSRSSEHELHFQNRRTHTAGPVLVSKQSM